MSNSAKLSLPFIMPSQAQKHVTHNEAIELLDALVQMVVTDLDLPTPPETPFEGQIVSVGEPAAADFSGREGQLACFYGGGWVFVSPREGYRAWVTSREGLFVHRGGTWVRYAGTDPDEPVIGVGINASWTEGNRLSVSSEGTLLSHEGGGHQVYVNKAAEAETASLVFQTAYSGRAEMGLAGNDDFAVKVSPDGASWVTALSVEAATGRTVVGEIDAARLSGAAVQETPHDTTPGRLMRADWGYSQVNILGKVKFLNGIPSGSILESGSNINGYYIRFADGTQMCFATTEVISTNSPVGALYRSEITYKQWPLPFKEPPNITATSTYVSGLAAMWVSHTDAYEDACRTRLMSASSDSQAVINLAAFGRWN